MNQWQNIQIGDALILQRGFDITKSEQEPGPVPIVSSSGVQSYHNVSKVDGPGVVTGRKGTLGKVFYFASQFWPHDTTLWVKDFRGNNPKFTYYFLQTLRLQNYDAGASNPTLNRNHIHRLATRFPPLPIQKKIAAILSAYDDLIENNNKRIALLEEMSQQIYREWFVRMRFPGHESAKFRKGIPEGWEVKKLGEVTELLGGGTPSTKEHRFWENGDVEWMTPSDVTKNGGNIILRSEKRISQAGLQNSSANMVPPYAILMTSRASIGFFGLTAESVCTNQGFINIIPRESHMRMFLYYQLKLRREDILQLAVGATFAEVSKSSFRKFRILYPSEITLSGFQENVTPLLKLEETLTKQNAALKKARDLLLPRLMSGKLDVSDLDIKGMDAVT